MSRAVFLDRDGTINRKLPDDRYVIRWEQVEFLPDVARAIELLNKSGFLVIVVSNQRCVAKGLIQSAELETIHRRMCDELAANGAKIDYVYYCPHEENPPCSCRKPAPGMLLQAARAHEIDLTVSWMVGDSEIDIEAGKNAGCRTARVLINGNRIICNPDVVGRSLLETVNKLLIWNHLKDARHSTEHLSGRSTNPTEPHHYPSS
jgi:D-glycero-D-manno-heptose 1,7-bisphosphate phosphatase